MKLPERLTVVRETYEVMVRQQDGLLGVPHYPAAGRRIEFEAIFEARRWLERHWGDYAPYNQGEPVVVKRG